MNVEQKIPEEQSRNRPPSAKKPESQRTGQPQGRRFLLLALALIVLAAAVGGGYFFWQLQVVKASQTVEEASAKYRSTTVRRSDLTLSISGNGTVIPAQTVDLAFSVEGTVGELNVQVGDEVTEGQVLAVLADTAALKQEILDQQLAVKVAQKKVDDLLSGGEAVLAQALADQASAEQTYAEALASAHAKGDGRCAAEKTRDYYMAYLDAQKSVDVWEGYLNDPKTGYGYDYLIQKLTPMRQKRDQAYGNYIYCQGYTDKEIESSQAALQLAKAKLDTANAAYEAANANAGVDPVELSMARASLKSAQLALSSAQDNLAGSTITAPMSGTVTAVNGKVGETAGTSSQASQGVDFFTILMEGGGTSQSSSSASSSGAFITITNMNLPEIQANMDETDLQNFAVGCAAEVTFDSLPGQTFEGTVTRVEPVLVTVNNSSMVQGLVDLQQKHDQSGKVLSIGLTASVEVTCKQAKDALVVPAQALYQPEGKPAYVYVLNSAGEPEKREVQVGLSTVASAQITSGLSEGEKVITSQIEAAK